jgi:hypothetical protein
VTEVLDPIATTNPFELPDDIFLDHDIVDESQPYLGVIILDEWQPNRAGNGYEWHLYVRPIDFIVKGELACFFNRAKISTSANSKMMRTLDALQKVFGKSKQPIGKKHLVGKIGVFVNRQISFGIGDDGTEIKSRVILAVRKATDEETARAQATADAVMAGNLAPSGGTSAPIAGYNPQPQAPSFSESDLDAMFAVVEGKAPQEYQMAALGSGLPAPLMNAVLSGAAVKALKDAGRL